MKIARSIAQIILALLPASSGRSEGQAPPPASADRPATAQAQIAGPSAQPTTEPPQMVVDDGQLISHDFTVFVTYQLTPAMAPTLRLSGSHFLTKSGALENSQIPAKLVAPHQYRQITIGTTSVPVEGTVLSFDVTRYPIPFYKAATRLLPTLQWTDPPAPGQKQGDGRSIVAVDEVYLGNLTGAIIWTVLTVGIVGLTMMFWSAEKSKQVTKFPPRPCLLIITGPDGYLSLWRTQLLLWTVAVGSVVFLFGLVRLHVPDIPDTLVALMGMSLLTGTVSATKARLDTTAKLNKQNQDAPDPAVALVVAASTAPADGGIAPAAPAAAGVIAVPPVPPVVKMNRSKAHFADLISNWNEHIGQLEISIPKAQMVFWTVIILGLFVVKSILLGALWPVPWPMVALTGMSQAGYIGDKYVQSISPED